MTQTYRRLFPVHSPRVSAAHGFPPPTKPEEARASLPSHSRLARQPALRRASRPPSLPLGTRCCEKGCIFPATEPGTDRCLVHALEEREPQNFHSCQPTMLILNQAKYGPPDPEADYSRARDQRRLAAWREAFLEEVA